MYFYNDIVPSFVRNVLKRKYSTTTNEQVNTVVKFLEETVRYLAMNISREFEVSIS